MRNNTVLVVGHITIPNIIAELGGPQLPTICESVFSDLFLLAPALGWDGLTRLRYGAAENISPGCRNCLSFCARIQTSDDKMTIFRSVS
jgi:hypothetical protein